MMLSMMIVMTMMIKQTDDQQKYDDEGRGVADPKYQNPRYPLIQGSPKTYKLNH